MRRVYRGFRDRSLSVWLAWALGGGKLPNRTKPKKRTFMHPEDPLDGHLIWLRPLIFVLGPVLVVVALFSVLHVVSGGTIEFDGIPFVLFFSLIVCAIAGTVDGILDFFVPGWSRVALTAIVGAVVGAGVAFAFFLYLSIHLEKPMVPPTLYPLIAISSLFGAFNAGACSLLTHCFCRKA